MELTKFWEEVIEGYNQVAATNERQITVAREGKVAVVFYEAASDNVVIAVKTASTQTVEPLAEP